MITYRAVIVVCHSVFLVFPAGRLLLGVLAPEKAVGPLQQRHVLLLHRAMRPFKLRPLVWHHARGRHFRPPWIPTRGRHTMVNPFPRLAEELLFFPAQYAHPYHLRQCYVKNILKTDNGEENQYDSMVISIIPNVFLGTFSSGFTHE